MATQQSQSAFGSLTPSAVRGPASLVGGSRSAALHHLQPPQHRVRSMQRLAPRFLARAAGIVAP
jgi:hypothetical protein